MTSPILSAAAGDGADAICRPSFDDHLQQAMGGLRIALLKLLQSVNADPTTPQKVSRRFGINRNLAWKVSRLISESDERASVRHVPGKQGLRILCERFREAGAPIEVVNAVSDAMDAFLQMVEVQAGDRTALDMTLRSLRPEGEGPEGVLTARKLAFQGNSAVWGVRARLKLGLQVVAPANSGSRDGEVDIARVGGLLDFWRLRADARWPLIHYRMFPEESASGRLAVEPIESPAEDSDDPPWLRDFCSVPPPRCRRVKRVPGDLFEIMEGPVGNTASFSCVYGQVTRNAATYLSDGAGTMGEHQLRLNVPMGGAHFDVLLHESLPLQAPPRIVVESWMQVSDTPRPVGEPLYSLETLEQIEEMPAGLPNLNTADVPRYPDLVQQVVRTLGRPLREFRGYRVRLSYPPIPTILKIIHPLAHN